MECGKDDNQWLSLNSEDYVRLQSVSENYFMAQEIDEELFDSDSDSISSADSDEDTDQDFEFDVMDVEVFEKAKVQKFYQETCKCKLLADEKPCSTTLALDDFIECRNNCSELSSTELDLVILGAIQCSLNCNECSISGRAEKKKTAN